MLFSSVPGWLWQVLGAAAGLALGLLLGAWMLRRQPAPRRKAAHDPRPSDSKLAPLTTLMAGDNSSFGVNSQLPNRADSPQQRLLERLRESNLDLSAQLRASAAQHARLLKDKDDEVAALKEDYDQRVEELRQTHSSELKYLMALLVEQVDGIHKTHASHVKALEAELDRLRQDWRTHLPAGQSRSVGGTAEDTATTTFAATELMGASTKPH